MAETLAGLQRRIDALERIKAERDAAIKKLWESEQQFKTVLKNLPGGVFVHDMDGRYLFVNDAACRATGYNQEELTGMSVQAVDPACEPRGDRLRLWKRLQLGQVERIESSLFRKDGSSYLAEIYLNSIQLNGQPVIMGITFDISERKRLENQLRQSQKLESIGRLAGGIAHDFNNMLGVIIGRAELTLQKSGLDESLQVSLDEILRAAQRSAELTRQLLGFARKQMVSPEVLVLNEAVAGMINMLGRLIGEDIDLSWMPQDDLWSIRIDPSQLDQILANLCVNARDAIAGVGRITIESGNVTFDETYCKKNEGFMPGDFVMLAVSDNGCGMTQEIRDNVFDPFYTTKGRGKGTGLGLSTVYGIVKQNNGFINVYSEPGHGSCFKVYLPRHDHSVVSSSRATIPKNPCLQSGSATVLIVEDEPAILDMAALMLGHQGYQVIKASTPGEAIRISAEFQGEIDLLLSDVVMPEMDCRELTAVITRRRPGIATLFMSGYTGNVIAHHEVLDKNVHFIQKPFSHQMLLSKVEAALQGMHGGQ